MTCFRLGSKGTLLATNPAAGVSRSQPLPPPLVEFSSRSQDRANLMSPNLGSASSLSARRRVRPRPNVGNDNRRRRAPKTTPRAGRRKRTRVSRIRIVRGRVALRVSGRPGIQHIGAGQLVRFVPLNKLQAAARRVLGQSVTHRRQRRRRRQRQRQQQQQQRGENKKPVPRRRR